MSAYMGNSINIPWWQSPAIANWRVIGILSMRWNYAEMTSVILLRQILSTTGILVKGCFGDLCSEVDNERSYLGAASTKVPVRLLSLWGTAFWVSGWLWTLSLLFSLKWVTLVHTVYMASILINTRKHERNEQSSSIQNMCGNGVYA